MASKPTEPSKPAGPATPKPVHVGGESIVDRLLPHVKKIAVGFIVLTVLLTGGFGYRACQRGKQAAATQQLAAVLELARDPLAKPGMPSDPAKNPGYATPQARAEAMLAEARKRGVSLPPQVEASLLADAGKLDEAIAAYHGCEQGLELEHVLCREGLGLALEAKALAAGTPAARQQGLEEALAVFERMQPVEDGPRRAFAVYHQARIKLETGKQAEGKSLLEQAKTMQPSPDLVQLIDQRLASIGAA